MKKNFKEINPELKNGDFIMLLHMDGEFLSVGTKGLVGNKIPQPRQRPTDPGYGYEVKWYDTEGNIISTYPLFPESDGWVFDKEYYDSNPENVNESMFNNVDDLVDWGDFLSLFSRSELNDVCEMFELERRSGFSNMHMEGGRFLLTGPDYIKSFLNLKSYETEFDEDDEQVHNAILSRAQKVRDIFIRNAMTYLENKGQETEIEKIKRTMLRLAQTAKKYWMKNADKFLDKEIE